MKITIETHRTIYFKKFLTNGQRYHKLVRIRNDLQLLDNAPNRINRVERKARRRNGPFGAIRWDRPLEQGRRGATGRSRINVTIEDVVTVEAVAFHVVRGLDYAIVRRLSDESSRSSSGSNNSLRRLLIRLHCHTRHTFEYHSPSKFDIFEIARISMNSLYLFVTSLTHSLTVVGAISEPQIYFFLIFVIRKHFD